MRVKSIDLSSEWERLVERGAIKNVFKDKKGKFIEAGVRMGSHKPELYAVEIDSGRNACPPPQIERLENGVEIHFSAISSLKPSTKPASLGQLIAPASKAQECRFACQDLNNPLSILKRNFLAQVAFTNFEWRAFPNVAPWEPRGQIIWVPCQTTNNRFICPHEPQVLTFSYVSDFLELVRESKGLLTFFTSLPNASVNHMHFQSAYSDRKLPVESASRARFGSFLVLKDYPATGLVFEKDVPASTFWSIIEKAQNAGHPFNFIALSKGIYLFIRNPGRDILEEFPGRPLGAIEFVGHINTADLSDLERITPDLVASAFKKITLNAEALARLLDL